MRKRLLANKVKIANHKRSAIDSDKPKKGA